MGKGGSSKPIEVNLQAFLGHLRAQKGNIRAREEGTTYFMPPAASTKKLPRTAEAAEASTAAAAAACPGYREEPPPHFALPSFSTPLPHHELPSFVAPPRRRLRGTQSFDILPTFDLTTPPNTAATDAVTCSEPSPRFQERVRSHSGEPADEYRDTQQAGARTAAAPEYHHQPAAALSSQATNFDSSGSTEYQQPAAAVSSSRATFDGGGDFMGLRGYGEAKVHDLFAPPFTSPSSPPRRRPKTPIKRELPGERRYQGGIDNDSQQRYPLPPIAIVSGISGGGRRGGGRRRGNNYAGAGLGSSSVLGEEEEEEEDRKQRGVEDAADYHAAGLGGRRSSSTAATNNDHVFHAFLNLGRRLPRRLRRDREENREA